MKRFITMVSLLLCLLFLFGCENKSNNATHSVTFFYVQNEDDFNSETPIVVAYQTNTAIEPEDHRALLELYLNGPTTYNCISPFPGGIQLEDYYMVGNRAELTFSPHLTTLSGSDLMVACACITQTVISITQAKYVQISVTGQKINGQDAVTFTSDSFSFFDSFSA